jgi:hypothetical protein
MATNGPKTGQSIIDKTPSPVKIAGKFQSKEREGPRPGFESAGNHDTYIQFPGFRIYVQTGIVLQVNSSPVVNAVLQVGQVSEEIDVQANSALVETRSVMKYILRFIFGTLAICLLTTSPVWSQATAQINGSVKDPKCRKFKWRNPVSEVAVLPLM